MEGVIVGIIIEIMIEGIEVEVGVGAEIEAGVEAEIIIIIE